MGVGHPPARADGGTLSHGELRVLSHLSLGFPAMPRTREQRRMKTAGEWADLPDELLAKVRRLQPRREAWGSRRPLPSCGW